MNKEKKVVEYGYWPYIDEPMLYVEELTLKEKNKEIDRIFNAGKKQAIEDVKKIISKLDDYDMEVVKVFRRELRIKLESVSK